MNRILYIVLSLMFIAGGAGLAYWMSSPHSNQTSQSTKSTQMAPEEGQLAPGFSVSRLDGQEVKLADYKGKVVFLNFWATWCAPCKEEMPSMERLYQKMKGKPFEILAVSVDQGDSQPLIQEFLKTTPVSFPIFRDPEQGISKKQYRTTGVPESFIIGKDGKLVKRVIGGYEWDQPQIIEYFEKLF